MDIKRGFPATIVIVLMLLTTPSGAEPAQQFAIDADRSWLRILAYRGGLLSGLGHNHVIAHRNIAGQVTLNDDLSLAELSLRLDVADFEVDVAADREAAGEEFPGEIPPKDIAGTRKNMFGRKLLDAENHVSIDVVSNSSNGQFPDIEIEAIVTVRGQEHRLTIPAAVEFHDDTFVASGNFSLSHKSIGLKPFKAALGALRVRDELQIDFEICGVRAIGPVE